MMNIIYAILKFLGNILFRILFFPKIVGSENIPKNGSVVIACNHTNNLDGVFLFCTFKRNIYILAKKELFSSSFYNFFFRCVGCIPVDRSIHDEKAKSEVNELLKNGGVLGIFPEGTINRTLGTKNEVKLLPFKRGAVSFASKNDAYIVPTVISGEYKLFGGIVITYGKAYKIKDDFDKESKKLQKTMESMIKKSQINKK